jgi:1-deoxy-D-xylulose-5-phosphate reductoisomerase
VRPQDRHPRSDRLDRQVDARPVERSPERFEVVAVTAATNAEALADIARRTGAKLAVIADESAPRDLQELLVGTDCRAAAGEDALIEAAPARPSWSLPRSSAARA